MLILMTRFRQAIKLFAFFVSAVLLGACGVAAPTATFTATTVPSATVTAVPSLLPLTPSITPSALPTITPTLDFCSSSQWGDKIEILSNDLLTALEPGGPTLFDRILVEQNPAWADFQQNQSGELRSGGVIFHETAFGPEWGTGINPAVILVTYGVERNWELPANGDLVSEVEGIRAALFQYRSDLVHGRVDLNQYPVANGATYVLYRYFNGDLSKLDDWCHTYVQVYGESPLK